MLKNDLCELLHPLCGQLDPVYDDLLLLEALLELHHQLIEDQCHGALFNEPFQNPFVPEYMQNCRQIIRDVRNQSFEDLEVDEQGFTSFHVLLLREYLEQDEYCAGAHWLLYDQ